MHVNGTFINNQWHITSSLVRHDIQCRSSLTKVLSCRCCPRTTNSINALQPHSQHNTAKTSIDVHFQSQSSGASACRGTRWRELSHLWAANCSDAADGGRGQHTAQCLLQTTTQETTTHHTHSLTRDSTLLSVFFEQQLRKLQHETRSLTRDNRKHSQSQWHTVQ